MFEHETLIGIVLQTVVFLVSGATMVLRNDWSNKSLAKEIAGIQIELQQLATVITGQAVQTTRIDNLHTQVASLERRVEDLRRGSGYVTRNRSSIDGEYDK